MKTTTKKSNTKISNKVTKEVAVIKNISSFTTKQVTENVRDIFTPNNAVNNAVEFFNVNNDKFNLGEDKHWTKVQPSALPDDISLAMKNNFMVHWFNNCSPLLMGWKKVDGKKIIKGIKEGGSSFNVTPSMLLTLPKKTEFVKSYTLLAWDYIYLMSNNF